MRQPLMEAPWRSHANRGFRPMNVLEIEDGAAGSVGTVRAAAKTLVGEAGEGATTRDAL